MNDYEKNFKLDDTELNNKIKEYNAVYNNNNFNNITNNINNCNIKVKKNNSVYKKINNNNSNNSNNFISYDCPSSDYINLSQIENEYDKYISNLKLKLSKEREESKKKEEEAMLIKHRLTLLKNQEQSKLLQMKKVKQNIDRIINNRKKTQEKLNEKLIEKKNSKNSINTSWARATCQDSQINKKINCSSLSQKANRSINLKSNSQYNYRNLNINDNEINYDLDKNNESSGKKRKNEKNEKYSIDNSDLNKRINNADLRLNSEENKQFFKLQLIEKLKKDEEEKKMLEKEIAEIEEEEKMLLIKLGKRGVNLNFDNNNIEEND